MVYEQYKETYDMKIRDFLRKFMPEQIDILFESKLMTFLYTNYIILLLALICFAPFEGGKKAAFVIGIFVAVSWLHSMPITYMFISVLFSIADGIVLGQLVPAFLDNHYHIKFFTQTYFMAIATILFVALFIFLYYRAYYGQRDTYYETTNKYDEYKIGHDKWFKENRFYWDKVDYYMSMGKSERQAKALAKTDIKDAKKTWKEEDKAMKSMKHASSDFSDKKAEKELEKILKK